MKSLFSAIIVASIAASVAIFSYQPRVSLPVIHHDPRLWAIAHFMRVNKFEPSQLNYVKTYIENADGSHIDYRLLVAITFAESSGCKRYLFNNCWGYGSNTGLVHFSSIQEGITFISRQLGSSPHYTGKPNFVIAQNYGPHVLDPTTKKWIPAPWYAPSIIKSINEIH